ncbi:MAG TPA: hypothetical protein VLC09_09205 [Polyangiaceae bacterium]|nr:hypothetical protein [Polyangiaceae bacterium]
MNHEQAHEALRQSLVAVADSLDKLAHRTDLNTDALANGNKEVLEALGTNNRRIADLLNALENDREDATAFRKTTDERLKRLERTA